MSSSVDPINCLWLCVLFQRLFNDAYFFNSVGHAAWKGKVDAND